MSDVRKLSYLVWKTKAKLNYRNNFLLLTPKDYIGVCHVMDMMVGLRLWVIFKTFKSPSDQLLCQTLWSLDCERMWFQGRGASVAECTYARWWLRKSLSNVETFNFLVAKVEKLC